ncbi:MAG TPA: GNAT family N-acetyltransferase [Rhodocyclaceae bacterium]|nr:GNAT family N-acetyltransferase [Rhodocyclaceae bacterium]
MATLHWRIQPLPRSLAGHADPWDELNRRITAGHPLLDSRYLDPLLRHFGDGSEHLCLLERNGKAQGACILKPAKAGIWTSFFPPLATLGPAILAESRHLSRLAADLPGLAARVDFLGQDPDFSPPFDAWPMPCHRHGHALTIRIVLDGTFDAYWEKRSKKLRETMRGRDNRVAKAGLASRLVRLDRPEDLPAALERFAELEWSGWKGREGSAIGRGNAPGLFYRNMLENFAWTGNAMVYELWLGEHLAASQLAISGRHMIVAMKIAYDEALAAFSPGRLLLRDFIRDCFARHPGATLEGYTNAPPDLLAWATHERWIEHICLYRSQTARQMIAAFQAVRSLARGVARPRLRSGA